MEAAFSRLTMTAASAMLLLALVVLWRRHVSAYITAFRTQSIALALTGAVVAWYGRVPELFVVACMILRPEGLDRAAGAVAGWKRDVQGSHELHPLVNTETSLLVSARWRWRPTRSRGRSRR